MFIKTEVSGEAGAAVAKSLKLHFTARIPSAKLKLANNGEDRCDGMCGLPDDVLYFNRVFYYGVRAISMRTNEIFPDDFIKFQPKLIPVWRMIFDTHSETLLIVEMASKEVGYNMLSLRRDNDKWVQVSSIPTGIQSVVTALGVCGSLVLLGTMLSNKIYEFELNSDHTLRRFGMSFHKDLIFNFACTRIDKDNYVALSHFESVSVHRILANLQLEPLACINLMDCWELLFRGDKLLIAAKHEGTDAHTIISYRVSGNGFSEKRLLFDSNAGIHVFKWCFSGDRLVVWDNESNDLLIYVCETA